MSQLLLVPKRPTYIALALVVKCAGRDGKRCVEQLIAIRFAILCFSDTADGSVVR